MDVKQAGRKGGQERAKRLSESDRKAQALKAAKARWFGHVPKPKPKSAMREISESLKQIKEKIEHA